MEACYKDKIKGKTKRPIISIMDFRNALREYMPSMIWYDEVWKNRPYIEGTYSDGKFNGAYVMQSFLSFELDSLSQLESVYKEGYYIYV